MGVIQVLILFWCLFTSYLKYSWLHNINIYICSVLVTAVVVLHRLINNLCVVYGWRLTHKLKSPGLTPWALLFYPRIYKIIFTCPRCSTYLDHGAKCPRCTPNLLCYQNPSQGSAAGSLFDNKMVDIELQPGQLLLSKPL